MTPSIVVIAMLLQATPEVVSSKDDPRECKLALDAKGQPRLAWTSGPEVIVKVLTVATRGPKDKGWTPQTVGTCGVRCNTALSIDKKGLLRASFTSTCEGTPPASKCVRVAEIGPKKISMLTTPSTLNGGFSTTHGIAPDGTLNLGFGAHDEKTFAYGTFVKGVWTRGPTPPVGGTEFDSRRRSPRSR